MNTLADIDKVRIYYQEFHHKCVTWYLTIMGFFVAGVIAAAENATRAKLWVIPLLVFSMVIGGVFFWCIFHYGARIQRLVEYLKSPEAEIPENWQSAHKNVGIGIHGAGAVFFVAIILAMQGALFTLAALKFYW